MGAYARVARDNTEVVYKVDEVCAHPLFRPSAASFCHLFPVFFLFCFVFGWKNGRSSSSRPLCILFSESMCMSQIVWFMPENRLKITTVFDNSAREPSVILRLIFAMPITEIYVIIHTIGSRAANGRGMPAAGVSE